MGYIAATITTLSFLPQAIHLGRRATISAEISLASYYIFLVGLIIWVAYGVRIDSYPIMIANSATAIIVVWILFRGRILRQMPGREKGGNS